VPSKSRHCTKMKPSLRARVTLKDVAKVVGVSHTTVCACAKRPPMAWRRKRGFGRRVEEPRRADRDVDRGTGELSLVPQMKEPVGDLIVGEQVRERFS